MSLDDLTSGILKEDNPQAEAVKSLIRVEPRKKGVTDTDIELKTDFKTDDEICIHTRADVLNNILEMSKEDFNKRCILGDIVNKKERKLLSRQRKSRQEIVDVSKSPELVDTNQMAQQSFVKSLFQSRK